MSALIKEGSDRTIINQDKQRALLVYNKSTDKLSYIRVDGSTDALTTIDYAHHEIHAGSHFMVQRSDTLATGDTIAIAFTTPNTDLEQHTIWTIYGSGAITLDMIDDVTSYTGGTATTPHNFNHRSTKTSTSATKAGSDGVLIDPIVITGGSAYELTRIGSGNKSGGSGGTREEHILAKNEITIFRVTAVGNGIVASLSVEWYEHTPNG
jgi:hypothetical protein